MRVFRTSVATKSAPLSRAAAKRAPLSRVLGAALTVWFATGCASPLVGLAERGEYAELQKRIAEKHAKGELGEGEAKSIARAIASRELRTAKDAARMTRVREVEPCALSVDDALEDVAEGKDDAAGQAAFYLLDEDDYSRSTARKHATDPNPYFRQLYARTLDSSSKGDERRKALLDGSDLVRRAATKAAIVAEDDDDEKLLFEVVRLDPDGLVRSMALRAILQIGSTSTMNPSRAQTLADMWDRLDEPLRGDVGVLWSIKPYWNEGGQDHLRALLGRAKGAAALNAAASVVRSRRDSFLWEMATSVMKAQIDEGDTQTRSQAIFLAPLDVPALLEAVKGATKAPDLLVQARAHGRLLEVSDLRKDSLAALTLFAAREDIVGQNARMILARQKDFRIQAWIERDLAKSDMNVRLLAVRALVQLGRGARAAPLLTNSDVSVRTRVACMMLTSK